MGAGCHVICEKPLTGWFGDSAEPDMAKKVMEQLEQLRREIRRPCRETEKGFGLANVNERIHMYFGPEYGMEIQSQKGGGTVVNLTIPAVKEEIEPAGIGKR